MSARRQRQMCIRDSLTIAHTRTATTTSTMRLQLQVRVTGGGTCQMNWSGNENRTLQVTEIAQ